MLSDVLQNSSRSWTLPEAYNYCMESARGHYENFPVASRLIPATLRPHVSAVYAFARAADDFADELEFANQRLEKLQQWHQALLSCVDQPLNDQPIFLALGETIRRYHIPLQLFVDLLTAFKMDVKKHEYENFTELLHYCQHSANPVGRIVLHLFGYSDEKMMLLSDKICSGLQLANFWQDIAVDLKKPRVYLPKDEMRQFQYTMTELQNLKYNQAFRQLLTFQIDRTELMLRQGTELIDHLHGRLKIEIKCTCLGGLMVLKKIRQLHYDTLHQRPVLAKVDKLKILYLGLRRGETWKNL